MQVQPLLDQTVAFWTNWTWGCTYQGEYREDVIRAALTLKALTYAPSGALLASATTSLPEVIGGVRNWDYRFTWIRDATFALYSLSTRLASTKKGTTSSSWLEWSTLGRARDLQVMYGITGERRLTEIELSDLEGYRKSRPVRIGNGAHDQPSSTSTARSWTRLISTGSSAARWTRSTGPTCSASSTSCSTTGVSPTTASGSRAAGAQHWVYSKAMCWVALDRADQSRGSPGAAG